MKEKLKQIIQCNNENFVGILQIHEEETMKILGIKHAGGDEKLRIWYNLEAKNFCGF